MNQNYITSIILSKEIEASSYINELPVVQYLKIHRELSFHHDVTFLVGENGTGKSTLLEAIAIAYGFNPEGGTKNFTFHSRDTHSPLHEYIRLSKRAYAKDGFFLRAESFYNMASNIDELQEEDSIMLQSYGGKSLHKQSHGESFLSLIEHRFGGNGVYLLDEPEAALSPMRLLTLLVDINSLVKENSQFIIATHSPILMSYPNAEILEFSQEGIQSVAYKETEHYQLTKDFLNDPEQYLEYLFRE